MYLPTQQFSLLQVTQRVKIKTNLNKSQAKKKSLSKGTYDFKRRKK